MESPQAEGKKTHVIWEQRSTPLDTVYKVSMILSALLIPTVIFVATSRLQSNLSQAENSVAYLDISIGVLSNEVDSSDHEAVALRNWAADLFEANSPMPVPPETMLALRRGEVLLFADSGRQRLLNDPQLRSGLQLTSEVSAVTVGPTRQDKIRRVEFIRKYLEKLEAELAESQEPERANEVGEE